MDVKIRQAIERMIVEKTIDECLKAGLVISVNDGDNEVLYRSKDKEKILSVMFTTDEDQFVMSHRQHGELSWIKFVYGNDGFDVIYDYTVNIENVLKPVHEWLDQVEDGTITLNLKGA